MTTLVFVENVLGSGHVVKLTEDFGDHVVSRDLNPGEHVRLVVSPFKTISVEEAPALAKDAPKPAAIGPNRVSLPKPRILERRCG
jgi:hypothetical protein